TLPSRRLRRPSTDYGSRPSTDYGSRPSTDYGKGLGDHSNNKLRLAKSPHLNPCQARDPTSPSRHGDGKTPPQFHRNVHNSSIQRDNAAVRWRISSLCASTWCAITVSQQ